MEPVSHPNLDRVYTIMGYQPFQVVMGGGIMLAGMQLNSDMGWGWWGIGASVLLGFIALRFSSILRDNFPGRALVHLQKNIAMGQRYVPQRDQQHVPLVLDPHAFDE